MGSASDLLKGVDKHRVQRLLGRGRKATSPSEESSIATGYQAQEADADHRTEAGMTGSTRKGIVATIEDLKARIKEGTEKESDARRIRIC